MKPVAFDYIRPASVGAAIAAMVSADGAAKVIAGGQSLGPMLNLRLAQPAMVVDISRIPELGGVEETADGIVYGSCITHAAFEDGSVPDCTQGLMRHVAADIAYRAIRNRGTIGCSICHADPAADWVSALSLLAVTILMEGPAGRREIDIEQFMTGPFGTDLGVDEIMVGIRVPRLSPRARWSYYKSCRKPGEFAEAIAAILRDEDRGVYRAVIGATSTRPCVIAQADSGVFSVETAFTRAAAGSDDLQSDQYEGRIHRAALRRAALQFEGGRP